MSNKEMTSKSKKNQESSKKNAKNKEKNPNKQKKQNQKSKEKEENPVISEKKELSEKEREYLDVLNNLTLKIKNIEQNTEIEESKLLSKNTEKENRLQKLTSSNQKIKQTLNILTEKMERIKKNQNNVDKFGESEEKLTDNDNDLSKQDEDIKSKQKLINILSNENRSLKKSIDHYHELNTKNKLYGELKKKDNTKKKMEKEIKNYEEIMNKHNSECAQKIQQLEKEYEQIQNKLSLQNKEYHTKNKDYIYLQSKFSLQKKDDEKFYNEIKNKKNFLDMNKHPYLLNLDSKKMENMKINLTKKIEFARDIENGLINKYEKIVSLPKIDVNHEGKIISSMFTEEEMEKIKQEFNDEEKFANFREKVIELEKGTNTETTGDELLETCSELEKEIQENEENVFLERHKLKSKDLEINKCKQDYRNILRKNIKLKKEEKNLKENLENVKYKYYALVRKQKGNHEINNIIEGINDIVAPSKNKTKKNELYDNKQTKGNAIEEEKGNEENEKKELEEERDKRELGGEGEIKDEERNEEQN